MKCPSCEAENRNDAKFCNECGQRLEIVCSSCGAINRGGSKFCNECGCSLEKLEETQATDTCIESERKHVTILFSDLSGYTAMNEMLDPEEVREIMSQLFGEITETISTYGGQIEKFIGDAIMAVFGIPKIHEDDPIRAIKAATEIHAIVDSFSPKIESKIGRKLTMHTGINTGLVVTGEADHDKRKHGLTGDAVNLASRLEGLANSGEILVGEDTYKQAAGFFNFEPLDPTAVKGKADLVKAYKVISQKDESAQIRRLHDKRADLIGRSVEFGKFEEALELLTNEQKGSVIALSGHAGTGKSRLVEEFRSSLNLENVQWLEGHAFPYSQNVSYFPLIDLLTKAIQIQEADPRDVIREKVENSIPMLLGEETHLTPYIGSLFSLSYPEIEDVSPEHWKNELYKAIKKVIVSLAQRSPLIIFLEDLHWADPSTLELIRLILPDLSHPVLFICTYRPTISLFTSHQISNMVSPYHEIQLQDLSPSDSQLMVESLLKTKSIPLNFKLFIQDKIEGNPFYIEEMINSLIESGILISEEGQWRLTRTINDSDISSTIHGVVSGRVDRLENDAKQILQEASVIGRSFLYQILEKISELKNNVDRNLWGLERLDLIKAKAIEPELEFIFKHALTQEVVYNGLLKKDRKTIHERIGIVIEQIFQDRLPEFYETLSYHFKQGHSDLKAVEYLVKSAEKSMGRSAVEESHQYYLEAYQILVNKQNRTKGEDTTLIDLLNKWSNVYHFRGDFREHAKIISKHKDLAESLDDEATKGMFYAWIGNCDLQRGKHHEALRYLQKALSIGEKTGDLRIIGYSCCWISTTLGDLGNIRDATQYGERALKICEQLPSDFYLYFRSYMAVGFAYVCKGYIKKVHEIGSSFLDKGKRNSNIRFIGGGYLILSIAYHQGGDIESAIESLKKEIQIVQDPHMLITSRSLLGTIYAILGQVEKAEAILQKVISDIHFLGYERTWPLAYGGLGMVTIAGGNMRRGFKMIHEAIDFCHENGLMYWKAQLLNASGQIYLKIVDQSAKVNLGVMIKNVGFLLKNVPMADKKGQEYFNETLKIANKIGAKGIEAVVYLNLGRLHKIKKRTDQARDCFFHAIELFEECEAETYLKQAIDELESMK